MKMAISIESASVHSALRDSITNSTTNSQPESNENITNKIIAIAKKILLTKIEYEEVNNYDQSVLDSFKTKYTVLKPYNNAKLQTSQCESVTNNVFEKSGNQLSTLNYQHQINQKSSNGLPQAKRILFPRESVRVGWRSSGRKWQIGSGMMNVGNTCYLNSTLQALFHVPAMANWLISDSEHREECRGENNIQEGCIICAMAKTLICSQVSSSAIRPQLVYSRLKQICKHLIFGRQEDAHEFLRYLVEAMEKSYLLRFKNYKELDQYSKETTPLNQILGGYLKTSVRCLSCGHVSTTFQHFQDLLLDIRKPNTIEEALDGYFAKERLEDMGYKCESCKKKVSAIKQFSLERAPISLCIQLKRFSMVGTKINKYIAIRPRLDLTKYATNKNGSESLSYKLVAMVTHLGASQHCGHYTAIGLTDQGGYYQFDDSCVRPISLPNVLNTNAYIIFYELDENHHSKPVCTQVSGESEMFKNDLIKNNENSIQQKNTDSCTSNNESVTKNINGLHSPKVMSKLDFASENENETNNILSNSNTFIGPQLPLEMSREGISNNILSKKDLQICNDVKPTENLALSSSKLSTNASKLLIHFKNSSSNANGNQNAVEVEKNDSEIINKNQTNLMKSPSNSFKVQQSVEDVCGSSTSEFVIKKEEKQNLEINKSSLLPSMPKLDSNFDNSGALSVTNNSNQNSKIINKPSSWAGPLSSNYMMKQNQQSDANNKNFLMSNGIKKSPIKSLVPYGSDGDEDTTDSSDNENTKKAKLDRDNQSKIEEKISESVFNKLNGETKKCGFSTSNESTPEASPEAQRIKLGSPSPHIVKTKAGLWQVTPITPSGSPQAEIESSEEHRTTKTHSNPFNSNGTPIPTSMFYSDKTSNGGNSIYTKKEEKSPTIKELTKYSHRGYGANVLSWNGTKSEMDTVINEETRQERKRQMHNDEENEIDRGRQKKVKNTCNRQNDSNPGYNPFQEQQLQKNSEHVRHNWVSGNNTNRNSSKLNTTIRYHYQNNFNNNHGFDNMSNSSNDNNNCNINFNKIANGKNNYNNKDGSSNNHDNKYNSDSNINSNDSNCNNSNDNDNINNNNYNKFSNKFNGNKTNNHNTNSFNSKSNHLNKNNKSNSNNCFFRNDNPNYINHNSNNNSNNNNNNNNNNNQYNKANNIGSKIYNQHNFLNRIHNSGSNCFRRHNNKRFNLNQRLINHQKGAEWR